MARDISWSLPLAPGWGGINKILAILKLCKRYIWRDSYTIRSPFAHGRFSNKKWKMVGKWWVWKLGHKSSLRFYFWVSIFKNACKLKERRRRRRRRRKAQTIHELIFKELWDIPANWRLTDPRKGITPGTAQHTASIVWWGLYKRVSLAYNYLDNRHPSHGPSPKLSRVWLAPLPLSRRDDYDLTRVRRLPLTWLGWVRWRHLVVHQGVGRGLLMRHHAGVPCCSERRQARPSWVLVCLLRVLPVLLLFHLLSGSQFGIFQLLHVEVLAFSKQLLPLLF